MLESISDVSTPALPCFAIIITDEGHWTEVKTSDIDSKICPIVIG